MAEDRDGNMWFGLDGEIRRYNGIEWTSYKPEDGWLGTYVYKILASRDGTLYASTDYGISQYRNGKWTAIFPLDGEIRWPVSELTEAPDGSLWAATMLGALRLNGKGWSFYTTQSVAEWTQLMEKLNVFIVPFAPEHLWDEGIGVQLLGGWFLDRSVPTVVVVAKGSTAERAGIRRGDRILSVNGTPRGTLGTIISMGEVTFRIERKGISEPFEVVVKREKTGGGYKRFSLNTLHAGLDGEIWFGLVGGQVVRFDPSRSGDAAWRMYDEKDGLDLHLGPWISQTSDGAVWMGTYVRGSYNRFNGSTWTAIRTPENSESGETSYSFLETGDKTLWIGGWGGVLTLLRGGIWNRYSRNELPLPSTRIVGLLESTDGAVWIHGRGQEAVRLDYDTDRWTSYSGIWYQCQTREGVQWFIKGMGSRGDANMAVSFDGKMWTGYNESDGMISNPTGMLIASNGDLWAYGGHHGVAATARFNGTRWEVREHPDLAHSISWLAGFEDSDGSLWFGARTNLEPEKGHKGGLLRFDGKTWKHFTPPEVGATPYGIAQTGDGSIWTGSNQLFRFDGTNWSRFDGPEELSEPFLDAIHSGSDGTLWIGTRYYGLFHYDGDSWTRYDTRDGLADNAIRDVVQMPDGSVYAATASGISRFDGRVWTTHVLPAEIVGFQGGLKISPDGSLWINQEVNRSMASTRYVPDADPPETRITLAVDEVSQPGNTTIAWQGMDRWKSTPDEELQFSWRMDEGEWSPFSLKTNQILQTVPSGEHNFEVKARDSDFNEDPTPAKMAFTVVPPVYRQPWFLGLMAVVLGVVGFQASRIVSRGRSLHEANEALSAANKDLFSANNDLTLETALERVRSLALGMHRSDDIAGVSVSLFNEMKELGIPVWRSGVWLLDEQNDTGEMWVTSAEGGLQKGAAFSMIDFLEMPEIGQPSLEAFRRGDDYYHFQMVSEEIEAAARYLVDVMNAPFTEWDTRSTADLPESLDDYFVFFSEGFLFLALREPLSESDLDMAKRFTEVFSFAYARFKELERAEAQAIAAERRSAVDRVRAEIAGMRESTDLERLTPLLWQELANLGLTFSRCGVFIADEQARIMRSYLTTPTGESFAELELPFESHPYVTALVESWRSNLPYVDEWTHQDFGDWMTYLESLG